MNNETFTTNYHAGQKQGLNDSLSLSLVFGQNTFMFAVFSDNNKHCIELGHVKINDVAITNDSSDSLTFLINNYLLQQTKFDKVQVALLSSDFTLVPEAFKDNLEAKSLLNFTTGIPTSSATRQHHLNGFNFIYTINQKLLTTIESTFRNVSIRHIGATTIDLLMSHHSLLNTNVFINIFDKSFELAIKENNKFLFYNNFRFETNEDILYYLLFTIEQFELNPMLLKLSIAAPIETSGDLAKTIKKYIKQVNFVANHPSLSLEGELTNLPHHYYFSVLNQHLCEL